MTDKIIRFLAYDGRISIVCSKTTELIEKARVTHDLSPLATAAFGRLLTITTIMAQEMKNSSDVITIQLKGSGPIGTMLATSNNFPKVKGFVTNPHVDLPLNEFRKIRCRRSSRKARVYKCYKRYWIKRTLYRNITFNIR